MRLVIALVLFLSPLDTVYSAPHGNSEALLQELRNALNEKKTSTQQQENVETLAILCEPMATGFARVPTSQTQSSDEMAREQDPVSIGLGIAGLVVGLTGLGLQVADRVESEGLGISASAGVGVPVNLPRGDWSFIQVSDKQPRNKVILQEIKGLISQEKSTTSINLGGGVPVGWPPVGWRKNEAILQEMKDLISQEKDTKSIPLINLVVAIVGGVPVGWPPVGWPPVGWRKNEAILQEINEVFSQEKDTKSTPLTDQKRNVANLHVPLTEMLCTPVKVARTDKLAGGSSLRVRTLQ